MDQIFVQTYAVTKRTPVITITQDGSAKKGEKMSSGTKAKGMMRWVKIKTKGKTQKTELLNIGKNRYLDPKDVILEVISGVEGKPENSLQASAPMAIGALPIIGLGLGLYIAHSRKAKGLTDNPALAYISLGAIGLLLGLIPRVIWKNNTKVGFDKISANQKDTQLTDKAFENLQEIAQKGGKKLSITKDAFIKQFSSLSVEEKEAFVFMQEGTLKLDFKAKDFATAYMGVIKTSREKFGESVMESLETKMGNFKK